jgi:hypothetical protein
MRYLIVFVYGVFGVQALGKERNNTDKTPRKRRKVEEKWMEGNEERRTEQRQKENP